MLRYAFDKRIRPRCNVLQVLESVKLIKGDKKTATFLLISEKKFFENYITKYEDKSPGFVGDTGRWQQNKRLMIRDGNEVSSVLQFIM